jgi:transmembrane sensor
MSEKMSYQDLEVRRQRALDEAAAWLVRLQDREPSVTERSTFTDWLRESPLHVAAMLRVSQTDYALMTFEGWDEIPKVEPPFTDRVAEWPAANRRPPSTASPGARYGRQGLLGVVAAGAMAGIVWALWWTGIIGGSVFETRIGERQDVALNDGTTLRLGPRSRVRVNLSRSERDVSLVRGEAVFKVAKDPSRPFIVAADHTRVRAVGTEFGVERRADSVIVTVAEGRVAVTETTPTAHFLEPGVTTTAVSLGAGDQLSVPHAGAPGAVRKVDSASSLAWTNGRLVFDNDLVSTVVERFNQFNRIQLIVADPQVAQRRISGSFDATDPESFLTFMKSAIAIEVVRAPDRDFINIVGTTPRAAASAAR